MGEKVAIVGAGIAGLFSGLLLARQGIEVTVVERDPGPPPTTGDEAFFDWERRSVPQWQLPHSFAPRARRLLVDRAPDVLDRLKADGVEEMDVMALWVGESRRADDDQFIRIQARRPAFELALRRVVDDQAGIRMVSPEVATGLLFDEEKPRLVRGIRLADGTEIEADMVLDCAGRRSPVSSWLAAAGIAVPMEVENCDLTYYSRYFRRQPTATLSDTAFMRVDLGYMTYWTFVGDHDTYGVVLAPPPSDQELKVLRHDWAWEAVVGGITPLGPFLDQTNGRPIQPVKVMAGSQNTRRHHVVGGRPVVLGLLSLGDACSTTNPIFGWGASMALVHASAAVDALTSSPGDLEEVALAYDAAISVETDALFSHSAAADRIRRCRWRGEPVAQSDTTAALQAELMVGITAGIRDDPELFRAFLRRNGLLELPDALFADEAVVVRAKAALDNLSTDPPEPSRDEVLAIIARSRPG
jgi:2-polyprenyl-6-methoxyphenol hydroxylase-like FAD-dependent oxidoreductase